MFTKEKLEKWIDSLEKVINILDTREAYETLDIWERDVDNLKETQETLNKLYTSITNDGSI
jgi:exonuclease VII small subunit